ncbi:hypothetical protein SDC9_120772 [bioreactor metagenome]|uniref:Uncharacterized protein n=1 Tax=bioreactor metagenome TaxID=1076179 RepID=A0A645CA34_9ZZZZ
MPSDFIQCKAELFERNDSVAVGKPCRGIIAVACETIDFIRYEKPFAVVITQDLYRKTAQPREFTDFIHFVDPIIRIYTKKKQRYFLFAN